METQMLALVVVLVLYAAVMVFRRNREDRRPKRYRYYTYFGDVYPEPLSHTSKSGETVIELPGHVFVVDALVPSFEGELIEVLDGARKSLKRLEQYVKPGPLADTWLTVQTAFRVSYLQRDPSELLTAVEKLEDQLRLLSGGAFPTVFVTLPDVTPPASVKHVRPGASKDEPAGESLPQPRRSAPRPRAQEGTDRFAGRPSSRPDRGVVGFNGVKVAPDRSAAPVAPEREPVDSEPVDSEPVFDGPPDDLLDAAEASAGDQGAATTDALAQEVEAVRGRTRRSFPDQPAFTSTN